MKKATFLLLVLLYCTACKRPYSKANVIPFSLSESSTPVPIFEANPTIPEGLGQTPASSHPEPTIHLITKTIRPSATPSPTHESPAWCPVNPITTPTPPGRLLVAYVSDKDLWLWEEDKEAVRLVDTGDIETTDLSDDGKIVAFTRRLDKNRVELWAINTDRSGERSLVSSSQLLSMRNTSELYALAPFGLRWVPSKHTLAFNTYPVLKKSGVFIYIPDDIWLVDADSQQISSLVTPGRGGNFTYSPNGEKLAIYNTLGIRLMDANGRNLGENVLPSYQVIGLGESYFYPYSSWTSDSQSLLIANPTSEDIYTPDASVEIWSIPTDGSLPKMIGTSPAFAPSVVFSPDHKYVAFWRWPEAMTNIRELHIGTIDGKEDMIYFTGEIVEFLGWSPDSQHFVFTTSQSAHPQLGHICNLPQPITGLTDGVNSNLVWVDQNRFLYANGGEPPWQLSLFGLEGPQAIAIIQGESLSYDFALLPPK